MVSRKSKKIEETYEELLRAIDEKDREIEEAMKRIKALRNNLESVSLGRDCKKLALLEDELKNI